VWNSSVKKYVEVRNACLGEFNHPEIFYLRVAASDAFEKQVPGVAVIFGVCVGIRTCIREREFEFDALTRVGKELQTLQNFGAALSGTNRTGAGMTPEGDALNAGKRVDVLCNQRVLIPAISDAAQMFFEVSFSSHN